MRHPTIPRDITRQLVQHFMENGELHTRESIVWEGSGEEIDLAPIETLKSELQEKLDTFKKSPKSTKPDHFEGSVAGRIHQVLSQYPVHVLDNPGFWRFVTLEYFWQMTYWREQKTFDIRDSATWMPYVDATQSSECVPLRAYLRGQIAHSAGDYGLASVVDEATDFWRSHIVRVRTWSTPLLAKALIKSQTGKRLNTKPLRSLARRINRRRSSLVLDGYNEEESAKLLAELRKEIDGA